MNHIPFLSHKDALKELQSSQVLLLPINDTPNSLGVIPGKIYEYLGARRPIIGIGPLNGDSAQILNDSGAGTMFAYESHSEIGSQIENYFDDFSKGQLESKTGQIMQYSRKAMAKSYAELLEDLT